MITNHSNCIHIFTPITRIVATKGWFLMFSSHAAFRQEGFVWTRAASFVRNVKGPWTGGGFPDLDLSFLFRLFWDFPDFSGIFPICPRIVQGFFHFLFLGLETAPTRNSPERVRDTIRTFPEKKGNPSVSGLPTLKNGECTLIAQIASRKSTI